MQEVRLKVCIDQKGKVFSHAQRTSYFTLFCHRYSSANVDYFFSYPLLAKCFYLLREQIREMIPRNHTDTDLMLRVLDCLVEKARESY